MIDAILETLRTNNRINLMLFDAIDDEGMQCTLSKRGGRNVLRQFAHMHDVRRMQLDSRGRKLGIELRKFPAKEPIVRKDVRDALEASQQALEQFFRAMETGEARCFKKGPVTYLAYFVAHDAHHRGNILLTLKEHGRAVHKDLRYGIWDWDRR
ncbi:MAG: DinB family protein [Planctomycetota bacterium]|nr:DinB family protein [Planctomycetota bacterium]